MKRLRLFFAAFMLAAGVNGATQNETTPAPAAVPTEAPTPNNTLVPTTPPPTPNSTIPTVAPHPPTMTPTKKYVPPETPEPTAAGEPKPEPEKTSIIRMIGRTIGWLIILALSVLCFGAIMSNRYRIYYALRGVRLCIVL